MLLTLSILLLMAAMQSLRGQTAVENEHRLTAVETKIDNIAKDIADLHTYNWIELIAMSGLVGEAGIRVLKRGKV